MSDQSTKKSDDRSWPASSEALTDRPRFCVFFHGLFAFSYNRETNVCEVGTHAKAKDHEFSIYILEFDARSSNLLYSFTPDEPSDVETPVVVRVKNPIRNGVSFYESGTGSHSDWSRLPDVESDLFHKTKLKKQKKAMKPRVYVHNGVFFTAGTTAPYTFYCFDEDIKKPKHYLGPIAYMPGVEVAHGDGGYFSLTFEDQEVRLAGAEGKLYVVLFLNICPDCEWDPYSQDKEKRNDFYLNYKFFQKPNGHPQYGLMLSDIKEEATDERTKFFNYLIDELAKRAPLSSKDSPCGGIGFGRSFGLD